MAIPYGHSAPQSEQCSRSKQLSYFPSNLLCCKSNISYFYKTRLVHYIHKYDSVITSMIPGFCMTRPRTRRLRALYTMVLTLPSPLIQVVACTASDASNPVPSWSTFCSESTMAILCPSQRSKLTAFSIVLIILRFSCD
ncbi:hypothetical protein DsansV1_C04g0037911 [Dioscorea sansibarensis]